MYKNTIEWIKRYLWFIKNSKTYMGKSLIWVLIKGQKKAIVFANDKRNLLPQ